VIFMTAYGSTDTAIEAMKRGAYDYLVKPFERQELSRIVSEALLLNAQMKQVVRLPGAVPPSAASAPATGLADHRSKQADAGSVQIDRAGGRKGCLGAHRRRKRHRQRAGGTGHLPPQPAPGQTFIAINCAAIPENLIESELFGYERGAFTGAERTYIGKMERCDRGTCFLDEIGDMSMAMQAKLLRVLQEGEFERLGGRETIRSMCA
jgi:DNA-binding NtrC family response regulator